MYYLIVVDFDNKYYHSQYYDNKNDLYKYFDFLEDCSVIVNRLLDSGEIEVEGKVYSLIDLQKDFNTWGYECYLRRVK